MYTIIEIQSILQNLTKKKVSFTEIGEALGTGRANISKRAKTNSHLSKNEIEKIKNHFKVNIVNQSFNNDIIQIPYWQNLPEELKLPEYSFVLAQRISIEKGWGLQPENLCIVPMVGDKMAHYWYPMLNGDILIINTAQNHIMGNGVYFATSENNTRFWIREMQILVNNDIEFKGFSPSGETTRILTKKQLIDVDFKIIGKVIKNVSFRL